MNISLSVRPRLAPGCRLRETAGEASLLLIPEGVLQLKGVGAQILRLCDGNRRLGEMIEELKAAFPAAGESVESQTLTFLQRLHDRQLLVLLP